MQCDEVDLRNIGVKSSPYPPNGLPAKVDAREYGHRQALAMLCQSVSESDCLVPNAIDIVLPVRCGDVCG